MFALTLSGARTQLSNFANILRILPRRGDAREEGKEIVNSFVIHRKIRMSDADIYGNVHNLSIIRYAEDLAVEFATAQRDETGVQTYWGTAQVQATFSLPLPWTLGEVETRLVVEKLGRASITVRTDIVSAHGQHATVGARYIRFDSTGSRAAMTPQEREWYQRYLVDETVQEEVDVML
ncbi:acyl-CoA thioesterase [Streptomyces sp. NPDC059629]|uniref:acyl-CoA thioesterase n=1 Tax=Streptomyces sp. NPDC059629 TaxID=3346889 RepID=UPI003675B136